MNATRNGNVPRSGLRLAWASTPPPRSPYNLAITGLSVAICIFIGGIETLSMVPLEVHGVSQTSGFWGFMCNFNSNTAGLLIISMIIITWVAAILIWRYAHIEGKWSARLQHAQTRNPGTELTEARPAGRRG
jgi:high-affinity nickel-transport protein